MFYCFSKIITDLPICTYPSRNLGSRGGFIVSLVLMGLPAWMRKLWRLARPLQVLEVLEKFRNKPNSFRIEEKAFFQYIMFPCNASLCVVNLVSSGLLFYFFLNSREPELFLWWGFFFLFWFRFFFQNTGSNFQRCSASEFQPENVNGSRTVGCLWQFCTISIEYWNRGLALPRVVRHAVTTWLSLQVQESRQKEGNRKRYCFLQGEAEGQKEGL